MCCVPQHEYIFCQFHITNARVRYNGIVDSSRLWLSRLRGKQMAIIKNSFLYSFSKCTMKKKSFSYIINNVGLGGMCFTMPHYFVCIYLYGDGVQHRHLRPAERFQWQFFIRTQLIAQPFIFPTAIRRNKLLWLLANTDYISEDIFAFVDSSRDVITTDTVSLQSTHARWDQITCIDIYFKPVTETEGNLSRCYDARKFDNIANYGNL